jgi:hypothetical protein
MDPLFEVHMLNDRGKGKAHEIAFVFDTLMSALNQILLMETSRELYIACTKLEEACFFAKKAMANQKENHV